MNIKLPQFAFILTEKLEIASGTYELTFKSVDKFGFKAGQYVWIQLPSIALDDTSGDRQAFSITNSQTDSGEIKIIFRTGVSSYKKSLISLEPGSPVNVIGPFGRSFIFPTDNKPLVLIGGGVGVAPFLSLVKTAKETNRNIELHFYYVDSIQIKDFGGNYLGNRFDLNLIKDNINFSDSLFYISGTQGFVDDVYKKLIAGGVKKEQLRFENYYPSTPEVETLQKIFNKPLDDENYDTSALFKSAIGSASNHIIITDINGHVVFANSAAQKITGFSFEEMKNNTPRLWGGLMNNEFYNELWSKKTNGQTFDGEVTNRRKNGEIYKALAHIAPIKMKDGRILGFIASEEDITQLRNAEESVRLSALQLTTFFNISNDLMCVAGTDGFFKRVNPAFSRILGYPTDEILKTPFINLTHPEDIEATKKEIEKLSQGQKTINFLNRYRKSNGEYVWLQWSASPVGELLYATARDFSEVKKVEKMKDEFVSLASHELRTPMTAIKGFTSMIMDGDYGTIDTNLVDPLKNIQISTDRLINLVNDMLNLSRIESGRLKINLENIDVHKATTETINILTPIAKDKKLDLKVEGGEGVLIQADSDKLRQILINLVGNSLKFTDSGEIKTVINTDGESAKISVTDTGIGIPKADQNRVFGKFEQVSNSIKGRPQGTGLGLYICKMMVEKMGGKMWLESSNEGVGSTFSFTLPLFGSKTAVLVQKSIESEALEHPDQK